MLPNAVFENALMTVSGLDKLVWATAEICFEIEDIIFSWMGWLPCKKTQKAQKACANDALQQLPF